MSSEKDYGDFVSKILGIWRTGQTLYEKDDVHVLAAQPADSLGSPRYDYAIKTLATSNTVAARPVDTKQQLARFVQAATVRHPNLVAVLDASDSTQSPYLVMPRLHAMTMQERIDSLPRLDVPITLWWTRQAAQAIEALHSSGWVHGDVQSENLLVDEKGHVTLIDLGNATQLHSHFLPLHRGNSAYAAPELLSGQTAAIPAMDVFALGRVLWKNLTQAVVADPSVMERVAELIETMLSPAPDQRPTVSSVITQLLSLEIESLGGHIGLQTPAPAHRRAA